MIEFVDPRSNPQPSARVSREPAAHGDDLRELVRFCANGCVYEAERWIYQGRPIQALNYKVPKRGTLESPLRAAVRTKHRDLVLLLLCNGYDLRLEPIDRGSVLDEALEARAFDLADLLLAWGADPKSVDLETLFDTYKTELFERFQNLGIDLTKGHALAEALAHHTSNRPLFGFAKRHRTTNPRMQTELNIALGHHAAERNEKGVQLCLWAGADPHAPAPCLRFWRQSAGDDENQNNDDDGYMVSAIHEACSRGHADILKRLRPDPARDDFEALYQTATSRAVIDVLAEKTLPKNVAPMLLHHLWWATFLNRGYWTSSDGLERLFELGVRWTQSTPDEIANIRHSLLKTSDSVFVDRMKLLSKADYCSPEILKELARTPSMRARMKKVGFLPPAHDEPRRVDQFRPTRSREVLKKFGVDVPKPPPPPVPQSVWVGHWHPNGREIKVARNELFERVWSLPVAKLAEEWGITGNGLKKVCRRLQIPVPPRGYWAKLKAGHRLKRPSLPTLPKGCGEEVIFRCEPDPKSSAP
jgi:hypothetical protein